LRRASDGTTTLRSPRISSTSSSTSAIAKITVPTAMVNCGIQSGVASFAVEMSWKSNDCHASRVLYHANFYRWSAIPRLRDRLRRLAARQADATDAAFVEPVA